MLGAVAALGIAAVLVGVPGMSKPLTGLFASSRTDVINFEVRRANLPVTVVERGSLESSHNEDVVCEVEGQTTIITILPEGTRVTKGQLVCELDSATLSDNLTNQRITTQGAEASYQNAKLTREVAEIAVNEYREGIYKQEMQTALGEIALAESDLQARRGPARLVRQDAREEATSRRPQNIADKLSLQKSKFSLEQAQTKLKVLKEYTYSKTIKELESEVEKALSDELAKKATWELEKAKEAKLERQIKNCKLYAPDDGLVVYANDPNRFGGSNPPQIEEGATVRERQKIFSLPDITNMRVNTKVHESMIDRITPGLRARIRVDAFAEQPTDRHGRERRPHARPDQLLQLGHQGLHDARADRQGRAGPPPRDDGRGRDPRSTELDDVLSVPVQADPRVQGQGPRHRPDPRRLRAASAVTLGITNDKLVEVKEGVKAGDVVALNPMSLMTRGGEARGVRHGRRRGLEEGLGRRPGGQGGRPRRQGRAGRLARREGQGGRQGQGQGQGRQAARRRQRASGPAAREDSTPPTIEKILKKASPRGAVEQMIERVQGGQSGRHARRRRRRRRAGRRRPGGGGFGGGPGS